MLQALKRIKAMAVQALNTIKATEKLSIEIKKLLKNKKILIRSIYFLKYHQLTSTLHIIFCLLNLKSNIIINLIKDI